MFTHTLFHMIINVLESEAVSRWCSVTKVFLKFRKIHRKTCLRPATLLKKDSNTGAFL